MGEVKHPPKNGYGNNYESLVIGSDGKLYRMVYQDRGFYIKLKFWEKVKLLFT